MIYHINFYKKIVFSIILVLLLNKCNSPSEPIGIKVNSILSFDAGGYIRDIALTDSILAVAADQNGYIIYRINKNNSGNISSLDTLVLSNETSPGMDDASYEVEISEDGKLVYIMDPLDIVKIVSVDTSLALLDPTSMPLYASWNLYRSIGVGSSNSNQYVMHSLLKHVSAEESSDYNPYSTSIVTQVCNDAVSDIDDQIILICNESTIINDLSYYCLKIAYSEPLLTVSNDQLGVKVYKQNLNDELDFFAEYDTPSSVESINSSGNIVFAGLSNDKGCYIALLDDNGTQISNLSIADGYSINNIDVYDNRVVLTCKSDGVLLYEFDQDLNFVELGKISTDYAYTAKFYDSNTIFVGTRDGFQIINFGE